MQFDFQLFFKMRQIIGNMCAHPKCRDVLLSCGILEVTKMLLAASAGAATSPPQQVSSGGGHGGASSAVCDSTVRKYAMRIQSKMGIASVGE